VAGKAHYLILHIDVFGVKVLFKRTYLADEMDRAEWGSAANADLGPAEGPGPGLVKGADGEESSCPSLWLCVVNVNRR
jgi:hypothetical protein